MLPCRPARWQKPVSTKRKWLCYSKNATPSRSGNGIGAIGTRLGGSRRWRPWPITPVFPLSTGRAVTTPRILGRGNGADKVNSYRSSPGRTIQVSAAHVVSYRRFVQSSRWQCRSLQNLLGASFFFWHLHKCMHLRTSSCCAVGRCQRQRLFDHPQSSHRTKFGGKTGDDRDFLFLRSLLVF